jgi:hypothetical protein
MSNSGIHFPGYGEFEQVYLVCCKFKVFPAFFNKAIWYLSDCVDVYGIWYVPDFG